MTASVNSDKPTGEDIMSQNQQEVQDQEHHPMQEQSVEPSTLTSTPG